MLNIECLNSIIPRLRVDRDDLEILLNEYIRNAFFPWVCIILLLNKRSWKRPVIIILIGHWFLRSTGNVLRDCMYLREGDIGTVWPYGAFNWYVSNALAHVFWLSGEIMGDWYPLLRTKAVTNNTRKMKSVYAMCIIYNLVKVFGIITFFLSNPIDLHTKSVMVNGIIQTFIPKDLQKFNIAWWSTVAVINIVSIFYDISVIYCMRKSFFDRLKEYKTHKENTFMDKFKQISEFRIIISLVSSMLFLLFVIPFVVMIVMENIKNIKTPYTVSEYKKDDIEQLRQVVLSINYNLMYIDQILLQTFVKENTTIKIKVNKNSNHSTSSSSIKYNHSPYQKLNITTNLYGSETLNFSPSSYSSPSSTFQKPSINSTPNSTMGLSNTDSTTFNDSYYEPFYLENKNYSNVELFNYYPNNERKYENSKGINFHKISSPSKDNDYYESHNLSSSCKSYTNNRNIFSSSHYCINDLKQ